MASCRLFHKIGYGCCSSSTKGLFMKFEVAQQDMNYSYFGGATGVLVSGLVWCIAGGVALLLSNIASMLALFFGGMFIHPLAMLLSRIMNRSNTILATRRFNCIIIAIELYYAILTCFYYLSPQYLLVRIGKKNNKRNYGYKRR